MKKVVFLILIILIFSIIYIGFLCDNNVNISYAIEEGLYNYLYQNWIDTILDYLPSTNRFYNIFSSKEFTSITFCKTIPTGYTTDFENGEIIYIYKLNGDSVYIARNESKDTDIAIVSNKTLVVSTYLFQDFYYLEEVLFNNELSSLDGCLKGMFYNCISLKRIIFNNWFNNARDVSRIFKNCESLEAIDLSMFNTSKVENMSSMFDGCTSLEELDLSMFNTSSVKDMSSMFSGCSSLEELDLSMFNTSKVENMSSMFDGCTSLEELDLSMFNTSSVTNMSYMFRNCESLETLDLSMFNTSSVKDMSYMVSYCSSLKTIDLSMFNTSSVTNMSYMFRNCESLEALDLSMFNTSSVKDMSYMFSGCSSLEELDLSAFDTSKVADMSYMFTGCISLEALDLSVFDTSSVTGMFGMFDCCISLKTLDLSKFDTSSVTDMTCMFYCCESLETLDLSKFDTSSVTNMTCMFYYCKSLETLGLSMFDTSKVEDMSYMFLGCTSLKAIDLSAFDTTKTTTMYAMFTDCTSLKELDLSSFNTVKVEDMSYMFAGCTSLKAIDLSAFDTFKATTMYAMFYRCESLETLNLSMFKTSSVKDMSYMFSGCSSLEAIDLSVFDTSKVADMSGMFSYCSSLKAIDLSVFDTSSVTNMSYMFYYCKSLETLDLSMFDTSKVEDMSYMFKNGESLKAIDLSKFDTSSVTNMSYMFYYCKSLETLDLSMFDTSKVGDMSYMFRNCELLEALDLSVFDTSKVEDMSFMFDGCINLVTLNLSVFNTFEVIFMQGMFSYCSSLKAIDLSMFNTSSVTNMSCMFSYCSSLKAIDLSMFNTSSVTDMSGMFLGCSSLVTLNFSTFNTTKVENMSYLFSGCTSLKSIDLSKFDTSSVKYVSCMFVGCINLKALDLSKCNFASVIETDGIFTNTSIITLESPYGIQDGVILILDYEFEEINGHYNKYICEKNQKEYDYIDSTNCSIDSANTNVFLKCYEIVFYDGDESVVLDSLVLPYGSSVMITEKIPTKSDDVSRYVFSGWDINPNAIVKSNIKAYPSFEEKVPVFPTKWKEKYAELTKKSVDSIKSIIFSNIIPKGYTDSLYSLNSNLGSSSKYVDEDNLIKICINEKDNNNIAFVSYSTIIVMEDASDLFSGLINIISFDFGNIDFENVKNATSMFEDTYLLTSIDLSNFSKSKLIDASRMFANSGLGTIDLSPLNLSAVVDLSYFLYNCKQLVTINIPIQINSSKVSKFDYMFAKCQKLKTISGNIASNNARSMSHMFDGCQELENIDFSYLDTSYVGNFECAFKNCYSLKMLNFDQLDFTSANNIIGLFYGCKKLENIDFTKIKEANISNLSSLLYNCESISIIDMSDYDMINIEIAENMLIGTKANIIKTPQNLNISIELGTEYIDKENQLIVSELNSKYCSSIIDVEKTVFALYKVCNAIWENADGSELLSQKVAYGDVPIYCGPIPKQESTIEESYVFSGWSVENEQILKDMTYVAIYKSVEATINSFELWETQYMNASGKKINEITSIIFDKEIPTGYSNDWGGKLIFADDNEHIQVCYNIEDVTQIALVCLSPIFTSTDCNNMFSGYNSVKKINMSNLNMVYCEQTKGILNNCFPDEIIAPKNLNVAIDLSTTYFLNGDYSIMQINNSNCTTIVDGDVASTLFVRTINKKWYIDANLAQENYYCYNEESSIDVVPKRDSTEQYNFEFDHWEIIEETIVNVVYQAVFKDVIRSYTVTFENNDGSILLQKQCLYGETPVYDLANPTKKTQDDSITYVFVRWNKKISPVVQDVTYKAVYKTQTANTIEENNNQQQLIFIGLGTAGGLALLITTCLLILRRKKKTK